MKINVWHSIEQCTIDLSIDKWHSQLKTRICAEGRHFKHMPLINLCTERKKWYPSRTVIVIKRFRHFELN